MDFVFQIFQVLFLALPEGSLGSPVLGLSFLLNMSATGSAERRRRSCKGTYRAGLGGEGLSAWFLGDLLLALAPFGARVLSVVRAAALFGGLALGRVGLGRRLVRAGQVANHFGLGGIVE